MRREKKKRNQGTIALKILEGMNKDMTKIGNIETQEQLIIKDKHNFDRT